jgi:hypothetical protein
MKKSTSKILLLPYFQIFINASAGGRRLTASGRRITAGTIRSYCYALKLLTEFETQKELLCVYSHYIAIRFSAYSKKKTIGRVFT